MITSFIPDSMFNEATDDYDVTQEHINKFLNDLATACKGKWEPVSGGYNIQVPDEYREAATVMSDLSGLIQDWAENIGEEG